MANQAEYDITIYQGDTPRYLYKLQSIDPITGERTPVDITHHIFKGQVRKYLGDSKVWCELPIEKLDVEQGVFGWRFTKEVSEALIENAYIPSVEGFYDIQVEVDGIVFTFIKGKFTVVADITKE